LTRGRLTKWFGDIVDQIVNGQDLRAPKPLPLVQQREFVYQNQIIPYRLLRRPRRSIGLRMDDHGLKVSAPSWVSIASIEKGLLAKADWILRQSRRMESTAPSVQDPYDVFLDQREVPIRGHKVRIEFGALASSRLIQETNQTWVLHLGLGPRPGRRRSDQASDAQGNADRRRRERLIDVLKEEAHRDFDRRIRYFSSLLGVAPRHWELSSARRRWGSCNTQQVIRLSWRLIHHEAALIDYVIVHELAHLKELNHSPRFWAIVESVLPDYRERRRVLRHDQHPGNSLKKDS